MTPDDLFQHLRLADTNKIMERLRKMHKVGERFPHSHTAAFLRDFASFFEACKREPKV